MPERRPCTVKGDGPHPDGHTSSSNNQDRMVLALACASQFVVILDTAIVNVALPSVQHDLGLSDAALVWVVNAYLLAFAGFLLLGGRAADLFGSRRALVTGLAVFCAGSLAAGLATGPAMLVASRGVQGLGAALVTPASLAVVTSRYAYGPPRARALGAWSASGGAGGMVGALAGGLLTTGLSWRWVFWVNVPVAAILVATTIASVRTGPGRRHVLDIAGATSGTAALVALTYGVMQATDHPWTAPSVLLPAVAGAALLAVFWLVETRLASAPVVPPPLLRTPSVAVSAVLLLLFGGVPVAMWFFSSLFLQNVLGYSALGAGLGQTPAAVTFVVVARYASTWLRTTGVRRPLVIGSACLVVGFGWLSTAGVGSAYLGGVLGPSVLVAAGIGLVFPTLMTSAVSDVDANDAGVVAGLATTSSQIGGAIALAVFTTAFVAAVQSDRPGSAEVIAPGYDLVFRGAALLAVVIAALSPLLRVRRLEPTEDVGSFDHGP